jgi:DNA-binding GntR family transcriptional regulator
MTAPASLPFQIATRLRLMIKQESRDMLPPVRAIAKQHGISPATAVKAIALLAKEGLVEPRRGKGIIIARFEERRKAGVETATAASEARMAYALRTAVLDGALRIGNPLPKFSFLAASHRVSTATIASAVATLSDENLVHKSGKRWIVGARPPKQSGLRVHGVRAPVALIAVPWDVDWYNLANNQHPMPFLNALTSELTKGGISYQVVQRNPQKPGSTPLVAGLDAVMRYIRTLGDSYAGSLIIENKPDASDFPRWATVLSCTGKKPAIYFDATGEGAACSRTALNAGKCYFRLHFDEPSAVACALDHLLSRGHRIVGVPLYQGLGYDDWPKRRLEIIRPAARTRQLRIISTRQDEPFWDMAVNVQFLHDFAPFEARVRETLSSEKPHARNRGIRDLLMRSTPSITALLDAGVTALVAMNDRVAHELYLWLHLAGIEIPKRLSLVSFDNAPESAIMPISTVDFGFERLGYLAAHLLIGDIAIAADTSGNIANTCSMIDRGSVAVREGMAAAKGFKV